MTRCDFVQRRVRGRALHALLVAVALVAWFSTSGCAECDCEISTSSTDREARLEKMREIETYNRPFGSYSLEEAMARNSAEYDGYEERYNARFQGRVIPGVGCEVCEWVCDVWDLRAMDPADFKERFREATRLAWHGENREEIYIGAKETKRLKCMVAAHPERLLGTLKELMNPPESTLVRYKAIDIGLLHRLDRDYVRRMLEQMAAEGGNYGEWARDKLDEDFDAGVPDARSL